MVRITALLGALALASAQTTTSPPNTWKMTAVNSIQARVVSDPATWDEANKKFGLVMKQNTNTFPERYQAAMDTVNTASVEGALFYVQTEGIDQKRSVNCLRKSNMSYVWFLNITIVQPTTALAEYDGNLGIVPEYGKFIAMDNGQCTPEDEKGTLGDACLSFGGLQFHAYVGPFIGGEARKKHEHADYQGNYWFSYPNSCFTKTFVGKDNKCRTAQKGGLCPLGVEPDGIKCTYSFDILGYIRIDDLVGITNMTNERTGQKYRDRVDFCKDSKIEYDFDAKKSDLTFWDNPLDPEANANRTTKMLELYNTLIKSGTGDAAHMKPLPSVAELTAKNPPCWKNSPTCAKTQHGCRRKLTAQICEVCTSPADDCKKPGPNDSVPPKLEKAVPPPLPTDSTGKTTVPRSPSGAGGNGNSGAATTSSAASFGVLTTLAVTLAAFSV